MRSQEQVGVPSRREWTRDRTRTGLREEGPTCVYEVPGSEREQQSGWGKVSGSRDTSREPTQTTDTSRQYRNGPTTEPREGGDRRGVRTVVRHPGFGQKSSVFTLRRHPLARGPAEEQTRLRLVRTRLRGSTSAALPGRRVRSHTNKLKGRRTVAKRLVGGGRRTGHLTDETESRGRGTAPRRRTARHRNPLQAYHVRDPPQDSPPTTLRGQESLWFRTGVATLKVTRLLQRTSFQSLRVTRRLSRIFTSATPPARRESRRHFTGQRYVGPRRVDAVGPTRQSLLVLEV